MENGDVHNRTPPARDDIWTESATAALVEAWGERFTALNRTSLRQRHWRQVADAVNRHVTNLRTDVECKHRIDALRKKYKVEKAKVSSSSWPLFSRLDYFIGHSLSPAPPRWRSAAAAEEGSAEESLRSRTSGSASWQRRGLGSGSGYGEVAEAVEKLGEIFKRVGREKEKLAVEVEKQRMKFAKDLEIQRMKLFMESQIQMEKLRKANINNNNKRARDQEEEDDDDDDGQGLFSSFYCLFNV